MMDDSDLDFVNLCSKLLKRVRKKPEESQPADKTEHHGASQSSDGEKRRRRNPKKDAASGRKLAASQPASRGGEPQEVGGNAGRDSGDAGSSSAAPAAAGGRTGADRGPRAKDTVLQRMQQFKRDSPQKMLHRDPVQLGGNDEDCSETLQQGGDALAFSSGLQTQDSDEVLALRLQQELDRESAQADVVDLEDDGLFFCQICQRNLSHMTAEGRTQHLNRCLDESEGGAPARPPAPTSSLPDCPICGKRFKSQKSRSAHLKRCSSDMGVSPAVLLQALQRQAEESHNVATANTHTQNVSSKTKGPPKQVPLARKKPRKTPEPPDEETMVALALSSSLLELQREEERLLQPPPAASNSSVSTALKWHQDTGKGRGKRKKGGVPRPLPLLLVQDSEVAVTRLQERVAALLLRSRAPSPPTPTRCPSTLPGWKSAAPLWQKSTLLDGGSTGLSDFYSTELKEFFVTPELVMNEVISSSNPEQSVQPVRDDAPISKSRASLLPSSSRTAPSSPAPSTPGSGQLLVGSQALRDLMELAEDGMTLTQCGYNKRDQQISAGQPTNLRLSGFVQESEEEEEAADLCMSGFLPETVPRRLEDTHRQAVRAADQRRDNEGSRKSVALCRLASALSGMVNNPQLSDVQLQVDSGEVFFAHSFMVYARCPLLAEMVHESGFGVQEEGVPAAQRVLLSDVPGEAVFALLQYLYTARCSVPASLQPDVLELASRFDLQELQQLCQLQRDEAGSVDLDENFDTQTDQAFTELLRSMWNDGEEEDDDGMDSDEGRNVERQLEEDHGLDGVRSEDREISEEHVNEQELEEIYEFAATQRKRDEKDSEEEEMEARVEDEGEDGESVFTKPKGDSHEEKLQPSSQRRPDPSLDRSYDRLFSQSVGVYEDEAFSPAKTQPPESKPQQSPHKPTPELSCRTLLQSSVDNLSLGSPPSSSNLPVPGLSPGHVVECDVGGDAGRDAVERDVLKEDEPMKRESQGPRSVCVALAPGASQRKQEPELIVLSDSSEEMEVDAAVLSPCGPSPPSPFVIHDLLGYTEIKSRQSATSHEPSAENNVPCRLNSSPAVPADCSPEVSWLIPSTPVQPSRSTSSSSTQTKSSMCRTRLFPKVEVSPPSSPVFLSPASPPERSSSDLVPSEGTFSKLRMGKSSGSDLNPSPTKNCSQNASKDKDMFAPSNQESCLLGSSRSSIAGATFKPDPPLHLQAQPYSSTPLHTERRPPPVGLSASLLRNHAGEQKSAIESSDRAPSESLEKTELGSFHLSPLSEPSDPCRSHRDLQKRHSTSSNQSPGMSKSFSGNEVDLMRKQVANNGRGTDCDSRERVDGEMREEDAAESSFQNSFLVEDEPPIAFNDSWGLDANPGCFSLRLEDSGPSSAGQQTPARSSSSSVSQQPPPTHPTGGSVTTPSPVKGPRSVSSPEPLPGPSISPSPPDPNTRATPEFDKDLLDSKIWDSWEAGDEEEEEEEALPLSQRVNPSAHLKTPKAPNKKRRRTLVPITPMPHYSDMETPELKNKLNRFGVRPLPKRQMILKLKEIHQYTHQLVSSDSEDEPPSAGCTARPRPPPTRPVSSAQAAQFKAPRAPAAPSPVKHPRVEEEEEGEPLSASQGSNTSSTAASEESERSNPELCASSSDNSDSDGGISSSQAASRLQDRLRAVRAFILSDPELYSRILHYKPLVLSQFQERLKAAGIRLGAARLIDYLDSQCITFTTAKPGHRRGQRSRRGARAGQRGGAKRKKGSSSGN